MNGRQNTRADLGRSLVLNALNDIVGNADGVLADDTSRAIIREAYETETDAAERDAFESALVELHDGIDGADGPAGDVAQDTVGATVDAVFDALVERQVRTTIHHETGTSLSARSIGLYEYGRTREASSIDALPLSPTVRERVVEGTRAVDQGEYGTATARFNDATAVAQTANDAVATRVLAALAHYWRGDTHRALQLVEDVRELDSNAWEVAVIESAARHPMAEEFQNGALSVKPYLRMRVVPSAESDVRVFVGLGTGADDVTWDSLGGDPAYMPLPRLAPETRVRFELDGPIADVPAIHTYYLTLGVVDESEPVPQSVGHIFLDGPVTADATERVRFTAP